MQNQLSTGLGQMAIPLLESCQCVIALYKAFQESWKLPDSQTLSTIETFHQRPRKPDQIWVRYFKRLVLISLASATAAARQQLLKPVGHGCTVFTSLLANHFTLIDMHQFGVDIELALLPKKIWLRLTVGKMCR